MTPHLNRGLVVLWSSKQDAGDAAAGGDGAAGDGAGGDAAEGDGAEGNAAEDNGVGGDTDGGDAIPKQDDDLNAMLPLEIENAHFAGLLVGLVFLLIFIPGFLCLWNIQPPQTFEVFDSNDARKKMQ